MTPVGGQPAGHDDGRPRVIAERPPAGSQVNDALIIGASAVAGLGGVVFGVALLAGAPLAIYGGALAISLLALAGAVRRYFAGRFPDVEAIEPRAELGDAEPAEAIAVVEAVGRRPLLARMLLGAAALIGLGLAAPVAVLGPSPGQALRRTAWRRGMRLVTTDGQPIRPDDVASGGVASVWPEGEIFTETAAVILVRVTPGSAQPPTVLEWVVDDSLIAYSKVCTHAGCPVALFREEDSALFCPCHQSTFDTTRGAAPTFGPAARALPQLPMGVDADGFLIALDDFRAQVGPAFG
ncbi:MAG TPA: Rieske 2Fe-2S domain-containing protein [Egibacteraceae bacterium]|nr:Rieske 2Fe-2S domain-containing protein [Egibacteraceae bacterium]